MSQARPSLVEELEGLVRECEDSLGRASSLEELEEIRIAFLGRKGRLAACMSGLPSLEPEDRPLAGRTANLVKGKLTELIEGAQSALTASAAEAAFSDFDPTMPGRTPWAGSLHPITLVMEEICGILGGMGFDVVTGPEVENDWNNFEALNFTEDHPARDMQDTLFITEKILLRTHTSSLQVRSMLKRKPPVAVICPGKVYRRDSDLTHTPMFNQVEALLVAEKISMAGLRGVLTHICREVFGGDTELRFRPSYFPFTEPSAEVDISCCLCNGKGHVKGQPCRVCKQTGWIEILGCGMVDPNVFASVGYDSEKYTGWAFGVGVERVAMLKYGIGDLRMFFENDTRFLGQF